MTKDVKCTNKYRDRDNLEEKNMSIFKESYINPKEMDGKHNRIPLRNRFVQRTSSDFDQDNQMALDCRKRIMSTETTRNLKQIGKLCAELGKLSSTSQPKPP